jgi:hypothetical protein
MGGRKSPSLASVAQLTIVYLTIKTAPILRWCLIRLTKNYLVGIMPKTSHFVTRHLRRHQIQVNRDKWQSYWHSTKATIAVSAASLRLAIRSCVPNIRD